MKIDPSDLRYHEINYAEARKNAGAALYPLELFRNMNIRKQLIQARGMKTLTTGL